MSEESPNIDVGFYSEAQFTAPRADCPHPEWWHTYDIQSTEYEVIEMVGGLIRGLQPEVCLETGTSRGFMARKIAEALKDNGHGHLWTYDPDPRCVAEARVTTTEWQEWVTIETKTSMQPWDHDLIDFAWFDSLLHLRYLEFDFYHQFMHDRTVVGFHDTAPHFGRWEADLRRDWRLHLIELPTPRGMLLGRVR